MTGEAEKEDEKTRGIGWSPSRTYEMDQIEFIAERDEKERERAKSAQPGGGKRKGAAGAQPGGPKVYPDAKANAPAGGQKNNLPKEIA